MRIAVITCAKYADAILPFRALLAHFWPDCPYPVDVWTDDGVHGEPWCRVVMRCAKESSGPVLMFQEDLFISAPVRQDLVEHGLRLLVPMQAGCVRLYPMPGGTEECGDPYFAAVPRETTARISTMPAIWEPQYLYEIARFAALNVTAEAGDFENIGNPHSDTLGPPVLAYKRHLEPWPLSVICSAISRGLWNPDAKRLCDSLGIPMDWSAREFAKEPVGQ